MSGILDGHVVAVFAAFSLEAGSGAPTDHNLTACCRAFT